MMGLLRVFIAFCALALLATMVFGQEMPSNYYDPELLELERALEAEIAEDSAENMDSGKLEDFFSANENKQVTRPSTAAHIDLTGEPLNQPLSRTNIQDSEGVSIEQSGINNERIEYVDPMNPNYFTNPTSLTKTEEIGTLSTTPSNLEGFGALTGKNGGFNQDLWQGVSKKQAVKLLKRIQTHGIKSPTMRLLLQKALITTASAPVGDTSSNWLAERIKTLHALGYAEAGHLLLKDFQSDWLATYPDMAQVWVENLLMTGEPDVACMFSRQHILNEDSPFWRQALLVCQAIDRDVKGLQLSLDLASLDDKQNDTLLYGLLNALLSKEETPRLKPDQVFSPLHAVMYSYYPHLMTPDALIRLPDMLLRRIVENKDLTETTRIQAAEKLVNDFAVEEDILALINIYTSATFSKKDLENPLSAVDNISDGSMARALLWQGIELSQLASAKSLMVKKLWERASTDGFNNISALLTPQTIHVSAHPNLAWFAPLAVQSYLKAGQTLQAKLWWSLIEKSKRPSSELLKAKQDLSPIFAIVDGNIQQQTLESLVKEHKFKDQKDIMDIQRILSTLEASNIEIAPSVWNTLHSRIDDSYVEQGKGPGQLWLRVLGSSLEKGNIGETLLLLAEPLMYQEASSMSPQSLANIITGLNFLELPQDAKSMALEILLQKI